MQSVAHFQYGWLLANADKNFSVTERRIIALAAIAPDIDSIAQVFGTDAFYEYHHIVLHNFPTLILYMGVALIFTRKPKVLFLTLLSFLLHLGTDYVTSDWPLQLLYPFSTWEITLEEFISSEMITHVLQPIFAYGIIIATIVILVKYRRTFLEVFSKNLDILIVNFITLPWKYKCAECGTLAIYKCKKCGKNLCSKHRKFHKGLNIYCSDCFQKIININSNP